MKTLFVLALLASVALNVWLFVRPPAPIDRAPVSAEIDHVIDPGRPGRFDCVVRDFAVVKFSDGSTVRIPVR